MYKEILRDRAYSFQKPPFFTRLVADIVGLGLAFAVGSEHKKQRGPLQVRKICQRLLAL
jgi:hypothetical protein